VAGGDALIADEHQVGHDAEHPLLGDEPLDVAQPCSALLAATSRGLPLLELHVCRPLPLFGKDVKLVFPRNHAEAMHRDAMHPFSTVEAGRGRSD
jgi:hypothetical protein